MVESMKRESATWKAVRRDGFYIMAAPEVVSRKLLLFYQTHSWARVALTLLGGLAILSTILSLSQWRDDRKIQKLGLFVEIKEGADGAAVAALLKLLLKDGFSPDQVPIAKANLVGADLSGMSISKAYFKGADLKNANFHGSDLGEAKFMETSLNEANFTDALLDNADFFFAKAAWINLSKSRLRKARFQGTFLFGANLEEAIANEADFSFSNLGHANLKDIDATGANFLQANLGAAKLAMARLIDADLSGADLSEAILDGANLSGAKFETRTDTGELQTLNGRPLVAKVSSPQIKRSCADPTNPPHLPSTDEFRSLVLAKCK